MIVVRMEENEKPGCGKAAAAVAVESVMVVSVMLLADRKLKVGLILSSVL